MTSFGVATPTHEPPNSSLPNTENEPASEQGWDADGDAQPHEDAWTPARTFLVRALAGMLGA